MDEASCEAGKIADGEKIASRISLSIRETTGPKCGVLVIFEAIMRLI